VVYRAGGAVIAPDELAALAERAARTGHRLTALPEGGARLSCGLWSREFSDVSSLRAVVDRLGGGNE
jgi:hypothetical protein